MRLPKTIIDENDPVFALVNSASSIRIQHCKICCLRDECLICDKKPEDVKSAFECPIERLVANALVDRIQELNDSDEPWVGIDLDGTLAENVVPYKCGVIGKPIEPIVRVAKKLLEEGITIKILTARVSSNNPDRAQNFRAIQRWCKKHLGKEVDITAEKDYNMVYSIDDLTKQVIQDKGLFVETLLEEAIRDLRRLEATITLMEAPPGPPFKM